MKMQRYHVKLMSGKTVTVKASSVAKAAAKASQYGFVSYVRIAENRLWYLGFAIVPLVIYFCYMYVMGLYMGLYFYFFCYIYISYTVEYSTV